MNETNPTVETHVWNSIVLVPKQITDWSGHLNFDKIVFPMLWKSTISPIETPVGGSGKDSTDPVAPARTDSQILTPVR
ncbi:hypothetical protein quinque_002260 [Culex quinquefasciatus]